MYGLTSKFAALPRAYVPYFLEEFLNFFFGVLTLRYRHYSTFHKGKKKKSYFRIIYPYTQRIMDLEFSSIV
jgi:hypothetical protein